MYIISETKKLIISDLISDVRFLACTSLIESNLLHTGGLVLKDIAVGTCVHLLSRMDDEALDGFWREVSTGEYPIVDFQGNLGYSLLSPEGLLFIRNDFTATSYEQFELGKEGEQLLFRGADGVLRRVEGVQRRASYGY